VRERYERQSSPAMRGMDADRVQLGEAEKLNEESSELNLTPVGSAVSHLSSPAE
jgi:hypothetical protein